MSSKGFFSVKIAVLSMCVLMGASGVSNAQQNNQPYAFKNSPNGIGMSIGGQQAILNQQISGAAPKNMLRDRSGFLLDVQEIGGQTAVVTYNGTTQTIPRYKGTSFREHSPMMTVGMFNAYFSPSRSAGLNIASSPISTNTMVNTWTARVVSGMPVSYQDNNSVETWTGQVSFIAE